MVWKLNKTLFLNTLDPKEINLSNLVGDSTISEIVSENGKLDYIKLKDGRYVYSLQDEILCQTTKPTPSYWLNFCEEAWRQYFIEVEEDVQSTSLSTKEYYMFGDYTYHSKEDLISAIKDYAGSDQGTYYYHYYKEEEYSIEIHNSEKVSGEYDQLTLDKVNEILRSKGVDFVIKGE